MYIQPFTPVTVRAMTSFDDLELQNNFPTVYTNTFCY